MSEKKMTRAEALQNVITHLHELEEYAGDNWGDEIAVLDKMLASIEKQKSRPRSKSSARIQNEPIAKEFIAKIQAGDEPVNDKWMTYNVRYCTTSQKAVAIARIAEEWGAIEKVSIKNRTYYVPVKDWVMPE